MRKRRGFTLIELAVVIAIIALIVGMLLPVQTGDREKSLRITCAGHLKQIGLALRMYSWDHAEVFPSEDNADGLKLLAQRGYLTEMNVFACPRTKTKPSETGVLDNRNLDYVYKGGYSESTCGTDTGLACDRIIRRNHKQFGNVLFGDGHVKGFADPNWSVTDNTHNTGGWPPAPH